MRARSGRYVLTAVLAMVLLAGCVSETSAQLRRGPASPVARAKDAQPDDKRAPVTIDADQLEPFLQDGLIVFTGNVVVIHHNSTQWADRVEVYLDANGDKVVRMVFTGDVRIATRDGKIGAAQRAEYDDSERRLLLIDRARLWQEGSGTVTGEQITIHLAEDPSVAEATTQGHVHMRKEPAPKRPAGPPRP